MASLLILKGANQGTRLQLTEETLILGRNPDCHIAIPGTAVSRQHAHITFSQGKFHIEDLQSRNGTFVNNQQITTRTELRDNDRIKICDFVASFHESAERKPLPPDVDRHYQDDNDADEPDAITTNVEASVNPSSNLLLEAQPAEKIKALLDISSALGKTLELDQLLPKILDSLFQVFKQADRGFMILADGGTGRLLPKVIKTRRTQDETTARFSRSIVKQCLETGACLLSEDASADPRFALSQSIADFRIRSVMCAPLMASDGKAFGVIQVDTQDRGKRFHKEDLNLLAGVANQASIALENARLHADVVARERLQRDLELARQVQRSFLPERPPEVPGYEFFSYYESAQQVGGDFYDFLALPPRRLAVTLGDVAGKGVPAALLMAKVSADIRYCLLTEPDLGAAVTKLNKLVHQHTSQMDRFITLAAALLDYDTHTLTLVNAGHLAPLLYRRSSGTLAEATTPDVDGFPLGVIDDFDYSTCQVTLGPGDCLLAFTDGITEAVDGASTQFQVRGVQAALQGGDYPPQALGERIVKAVKFHATGRSQHDDIALVCFGRMR